MHCSTTRRQCHLRAVQGRRREVVLGRPSSAEEPARLQYSMRQLTAPLALLVCASSATLVAGDGGAPAAPAILSANPLRDLPALRTPHLSWPFPETGSE